MSVCMYVGYAVATETRGNGFIILGTRNILI